jgi:uncharacterized protein (DUF58 family)
MAEQRPLNDEERGRDVPLWFGITAVLAIVSLALGQPLLALLLATPALALGAALIWKRYGLRRMYFARRIEPSRAFPDDEVQISLIVENRKPLPLPWIDVRDTFPTGLDYGELELEPLPRERLRFSGLVSSWPYERIEQRCTLKCLHRGVFRFGPATLATGDPFGFAMRQTDFSGTDDLLVYPRVLPITHFGLPAAQPFGDSAPSRPVPEDPLRFLGTRPYIPGDPPQQIHWRATARTNRLQSKTFERGATASLAIFLDLIGDPVLNDESDRENREWAISAAASLAAYGLDGEREVGLVSNAPLLGGARFVRATPSRQRVQLMRLLELLAQLIPYAVRPIGPMLRDEARRLSWGTTLCVVTLQPSDALLQTLWQLRRAGFSVTVLVVGKRALAVPAHFGFSVYHWRPEGQHADAVALQLA